MTLIDPTTLNGQRLCEIIKAFGFEEDLVNNCWRKDNALADYAEVESYIKAAAETLPKKVLSEECTQQVLSALDLAKATVTELYAQLAEYRQKLIVTQQQLIEANQRLLERFDYPTNYPTKA